LSLEQHFDPVFAARLALREKQIQQNYRPIIGIHKWFARRPGTLFRTLLLAEFNASEPLDESYWHSHALRGVIADPFMGGGTPLYEANRLGFSVVGADVNPMAYWILRQSLTPLNIGNFTSTADQVAANVASVVGKFYETNCLLCRRPAPVKYFIWVKRARCPCCRTGVDLFPGYLLAEALRHPKHVVACGACGALNEYETQPRLEKPANCLECGKKVFIEGPARGGAASCPRCETSFRFSNGAARKSPATHRMWAIEYHCPACRPRHAGRFFKKPDAADLALYAEAGRVLSAEPGLPIPEDEIPPGDETDRLHRWGYRRYRQMFNKRQLLGLGTLLRAIKRVPDPEVRYSLLTVFSDFLRYQNLLCRYDTYALKCLDVFSVHGFPVGLVQCENNLLGIPKIGSGSFRHFVEKYRRAKQYCERPFETRHDRQQKSLVFISGERIGAKLVQSVPGRGKREAWLIPAPAARVNLPAQSLDGVFTDPPYFANVQYAELMDFCYVWLRLGLGQEIAAFRKPTTRSEEELTGNQTMRRGLQHFASGLCEVFRRYSMALKPHAPLVFTYHHNDPAAYVPIVAAILDSGLNCSATFPAVAEMSASIHILGTGSSVLDTVFVCRLTTQPCQGQDFEKLLSSDAKMMRRAGARLTRGDLRCLLAGHIARVAVNRLRPGWRADRALAEKMQRAGEAVTGLQRETRPDSLVPRVWRSIAVGSGPGERDLAATI
jgi:adenine-specific DNA methylase